MTQIMPINGHLLIEPVKHESFMASQKETYEEIGIVLHNGDLMRINMGEVIPQPGDTVYFDSWLAAKYPGKESDTFLWLVKYEDIRAVEQKDAE